MADDTRREFTDEDLIDIARVDAAMSGSGSALRVAHSRERIEPGSYIVRDSVHKHYVRHATADRTPSSLIGYVVECTRPREYGPWAVQYYPITGHGE